MTVYNYFRAQFSDGETPLDDAPPRIVRAIERWLEDQAPPGRLGIAVDELADPALTLLALRSGDLVHVVAVPDRQLGEAAPNALRRIFESLYGGRLSPSVDGLRSELTRMRQSAAAPEVLRHFANDLHLEALPWSRAPAAEALGQVRPVRTATRQPPPWRALGIAAISTLLLVVGVGIATRIAPSFGTSTTPDSGEADLLQKIEALEQRIDGLAAQLRADAADRRLELAQLGRGVEEMLVRGRGEALPAVVLARSDRERDLPEADVARSAAPRIEAAVSTLPEPRRVAPQKSSPALPLHTEAPEPLPEVAAPPLDPPPVRFRIAVNTARVRAGPSSRAPTRGLLGYGARVVARAEQGEWIEIEPPTDFAEPSWIHTSLLEEPR